MADDLKRQGDRALDASESLQAEGDAAREVEDGLDVHEHGAWGSLWQAPAILLSTILIAAGLFHAYTRKTPEADLDTLLRDVHRLIEADELEPARSIIQHQVEPRLPNATGPQQAQYHLAVADWLVLSGRDDGLTKRVSQLITERYAEAVKLGAALGPRRLDRWTRSLLDVEALDAARERLEEMKALAEAGAGSSDAQRRYVRLLRRLVEISLQQEDLPDEQVAGLLEAYRSDPLLRLEDQAWVTARQAELRLERGRPADAVQHLLVSMRRLEQKGDAIAADAWGELYILLGRGYLDQGQYGHAEFHLENARKRLTEEHAHQGEALLLLGRIDVARGNYDAASERFDRVVRDFEATEPFLPALLARAETRSILGRHEEALDDYRRLRTFLPDAGSRRDMTPRIVAASLADRHDAALAMGQLALAYDYVTIAESLFKRDAVPVDVLYRLASTARQLGENVIAAALAPGEEVTRRRLEEIDPSIRHEGSVHYERAGRDFLRHARALTRQADLEDRWAHSLWLSGDSYDLAGLRDQAIELLEEYIAGRSVDDPRRAEVMFRLARAHHAQLQFEEAAERYRQVLEEHPRSTYGTQSHVPLAQCYLALSRRSEAEQQLLAVVEDRTDAEVPLTPDAMDYRDALIELGRLYYDAGDYRPAIERLRSAVDRYPADPRIDELNFLLADSYRRHASEVRQEVEVEARMTPGERHDLQQLATENLQTALSLFTEACHGFAAKDLTGREGDLERYAWLYRADCAFELKQYKLATQYYDEAARKYSDHHASMHALVQIINCYDRMGETARAEIAHRNALHRLQQLPDDAFIAGDALMDREAWEQWLRVRPPGLAMSATAEN